LLWRLEDTEDINSENVIEVNTTSERYMIYVVLCKITANKSVVGSTVKSFCSDENMSIFHGGHEGCFSC
jgi:hypothetical protein